MTDTAPETRSLHFERLLDAPIDIVWEWLTDSDKRGRWFAAGNMELRDGGDVELIFDHDNLSAEKVPYPPAYAAYKGIVVHEKIVRIDPPRLLAFTFEGDGNGVAEFALFPEGDRTRLVLTHSGVTPAARAGTGAGWQSHLAVLEAKLVGREIPDFWALHARSEQAFANDAG
ncbi:SRPBCC family protein [Sphingomonas oligophenolica]|uniref:SRPBCC family protein n=1 Tax=Sphingomonas oligophenolica TaxID=301154 RepID=A0ABU9Y4X2_9SPHN